MAQPIARWRYIGGLPIYDPNAIEEVCVQALTSVGPGSEGGIARVEFYISYNGGPPVTAIASTLEECFSTHARSASPIVGATAGVSACFPGYKVQLALDSLGQLNGYGTIDITATAFTVAGSSLPLDIPIRIFNDTDRTPETDRRPTRKVVWVDYVNGNDFTGTGSETQPYRQTQKALQGEMGGATIKIKAGQNIWGGAPGTYSQWWTSNGHRVTVEFLPDAVMSRITHEGVVYNGEVPGTECNWYFKGIAVLNHGCVVGTSASIGCDIWIDGGVKSCEHWLPSKRWSVLSFVNILPGLPLDGPLVKVDPAGPSARIHATNVTWKGNRQGPNSFYSVQDCVVSDWTEIGMYFFDRFSACNCVIEGFRLFRDVAGRVQGNIAASVVSIPAPGQMRIDATGNLFFDSAGNSHPMDISTLSEIVGTWHPFRAMVQNSSSAGNNGTFEVLSAGAVGNFGFPYVILANPNAVAGAPGASTLLWTIHNTQPIPNDFVHPDVLYMAGPTQTNTLLYGVTSRDNDQAQTFFASATSFNRLAMWNCRDGNLSTVNNAQSGGTFVDCLFYNNTVESNWTMSGAPAPGTCFVNNVINTMTGNGSTLWTGMLTVDGNHLISGTPAYGSNWTTGTWFENNPRAAPWSFEPTAGNLGTGSALAPELSSRRWVGAAGPSKGCWRDTGTFIWAPAGGVPDSIATGFAVMVPRSLSESLTGALAASVCVMAPIVTATADVQIQAYTASAVAVMTPKATSTAFTGSVANASAVMVSRAIAARATKHPDGKTFAYMLPVARANAFLTVEAQATAKMPSIAMGAATISSEPMTATATAVLTSKASATLVRVASPSVDAVDTTDEDRRDRWEQGVDFHRRPKGPTPVRPT